MVLVFELEIDQANERLHPKTAIVFITEIPINEWSASSDDSHTLHQYCMSRLKYARFASLIANIGILGVPTLLAQSVQLLSLFCKCELQLGNRRMKD
jgi:hypothetical protein